MKNQWYNKQDITPSKKLLDEEGDILPSTKVEVYKIPIEDAIALEEILSEPFSKLSHRCISVYRDAIMLNHKVYNICLGCHDIIVDGQIKYLTQNQRDNILRIKQRLVKNVQ